MSNIGGITTDEAAARLSRLFGGCAHGRAEDVTLSTGEVVAAVCVNCLARLPAGWGCQDCDYNEVRTAGEWLPVRYLAVPCPAHAGQV